MSSFDRSFEKAYAAAPAGPGITCPAAKRLVEALRISTEDANKIRKLCKLADQADALADYVEKNCTQTQAYVRKMHNNPYNSAMWRRTVVLDAISHLAGGYGVEALGPGSGSSQAPPYEYVNMGDTYATTLIYKRSSDKISIGSWGDIAERHPSWG